MEASKAIEPDEIREVVEHFASSARHAADAGFDGIEVHAAHGYLIHEFLSPAHNRRTDEYGGSFDNRLRFAVEVLEAVRSAVGDRVAVGARLVGDEEQRDGHGLGPDDCAAIAGALARAGLVDFVNVSVGTSGIGMVRPMYAPHLLGVRATAVVKRSIPDVPVFAVHRILTPDEAEGILERDEADAITLVRALIADPEWVSKAQAQRADEIRACTGCNQGCYGNLTQGYPITCVTNPAVGREATLGAGTLRRAPTPKRVVATGGRATVDTPSKSHTMPVAGSDQSWVVDHERALLEADTLGERVVILDAIGHIEAIGVGHYLAERGHQVTVVTPLHSPLLLDAETMQKALPRAVRAGVRWRPNTAVVSIGEHEVTLADVMSYEIEALPADHVVIRTHGIANDSLYYALQAKIPRVRRVGDAVVPRLADRAIYDGHLAGRGI